MAFCDARQDAAVEPGLAKNRVARSDRGQRAAGRDAERGHRFADDILAQHRAERRPAVALARERGQPGTF
jgi:hypothetical protein